MHPQTASNIDRSWPEPIFSSRRWVNANVFRQLAERACQAGRTEISERRSRRLSQQMAEEGTRQAIQTVLVPIELPFCQNARGSPGWPDLFLMDTQRFTTGRRSLGKKGSTSPGGVHQHLKSARETVDSARSFGRNGLKPEVAHGPPDQSWTRSPAPARARGGRLPLQPMRYERTRRIPEGVTGRLHDRGYSVCCCRARRWRRDGACGRRGAIEEWPPA